MTKSLMIEMSLGAVNQVRQMKSTSGENGDIEMIVCKSRRLHDDCWYRTRTQSRPEEIPQKIYVEHPATQASESPSSVEGVGRERNHSAIC